MRQPVKLVRNATTGLADFDAMANAPSASLAGNNLGLRASRGGEASAPATALDNDSSYLDIPAFLRRQAD